MPKKISILFLIILFGGLFFPALILAGDYQIDGENVHYEGLVPCGKAKPSSGESEEVTNRCQFCHLFVMLAGIIDFVLFDILPLVAILMIVIGGVMFFTAVGNPAKISQATSLLTAVAIGLVIIYSSYLIVGAVLTATGVLGWTTLDKWFSQGSFTVNCPITTPTTPTPTTTIPTTTTPTTTTPTTKCEDCGKGFWNFVCDEAECLSLGDCQFTPNWWGVGGKCETIGGAGAF